METKGNHKSESESQDAALESNPINYFHYKNKFLLESGEILPKLHWHTIPLAVSMSKGIM